MEIEKPVITHIGIFVKDARKSMESIKKLPGANGWKLYRMSFTEEMMEIGGTYELIFALGKIGDTNYEMLEFIDGPNSYFDEWWRNVGVEGIHHICYTFPNKYEEIVEKLINSGYKYLLKGRGDFNFCYLESPDAGIRLELGKEPVNEESLKDFRI